MELWKFLFCACILSFAEFSCFYKQPKITSALPSSRLIECKLNFSFNGLGLALIPFSLSPISYLPYTRSITHESILEANLLLVVIIFDQL